jgi:hypothetical protein
MSGKFISSVCAGFVLAVLMASAAWAQGPTPNVLWWKFDEGSGDVATDSSGNGRDGVITGAAWKSGGVGGEGAHLEFFGTGETVIDEDGEDYLNGLEGLTMALWVKARSTPTDKGFIIAEPPDGGDNVCTMRYDAAGASFGGNAVLKMAVTSDPGGEQQFESSANLQTTEWHHVAMTWSDGDLIRFYSNGVEDPGTGRNNPNNAGVVSGCNTLIVGQGGKDAGISWDGLIDDVRIYDYPLTADEIAEVAANKPIFRKAREPQPADGAEGVASPLFTWTGGDTAFFHNVYFGTDPENLSQVAASQPFELYFHTGPLVPGTTYYWRVDGIERDMTTIHTGDLWSFTVTPATAWSPAPTDDGEGVFPAPTLTWSPGQNALQHQVYFGDDKAAVAAADAATDQGLADGTTWTAPILRSSSTYYWRVDEILLDGTVVEGEVWSFTTGGGAAGAVVRQWWTGIAGTAVSNLTGSPDYPNNPSESELVSLFEGPTDWADNYGTRLYGWLKPPQSGEYTFWIASDDNSELWLSTDEDPANAVEIANVPGWTPSRDFDNTGGGAGDAAAQMSDPVTLQAGQKYFIQALQKEGGGGDNLAVAWQVPGGTREVIPASAVDTFALPALTAFSPSPANGAVDTIQSLTLTWAAGENATQHDVYFGDDEDAVAAADTTTADIYRGRQAGTSYNPGALEWGKAHYWRIDEIEADGTIRGGRVWNFTTADFIPIDDFETYTNEVGNRVFQTWIDGLGFSEPPPGNPGNGSAAFVGHDVWTPGTPYTTIVETGTVQSGNQSMPLYVNNSTSPFYSETDRTFAPAMDWTAGGVTDLSVWVHGDAANTPDQLYVGLSSGGAPVVVDAAPDVVMSTEWVEVKIPLADFAGVNLGSVRQMIIGVGNRAAPVAGGDSLVFIDNIRVLRPDVASP